MSVAIPREKRCPKPSPIYGRQFRGALKFSMNGHVLLGRMKKSLKWLSDDASGFLFWGPSGPGFQTSGASGRKNVQADRDRNLCAQPFTARYAQDAKNAKILFFYRIVTDDSVKQSALRAFQRIVTLSEIHPEGTAEKVMAVFSNRPFRFEKGLCGLGVLAVQSK